MALTWIRYLVSGCVFTLTINFRPDTCFCGKNSHGDNETSQVTTNTLKILWISIPLFGGEEKRTK